MTPMERKLGAADDLLRRFNKELDWPTHPALSDFPRDTFLGRLAVMLEG